MVSKRLNWTVTKTKTKRYFHSEMMSQKSKKTAKNLPTAMKRQKPKQKKTDLMRLTPMESKRRMPRRMRMDSKKLRLTAWTRRLTKRKKTDLN